MTRKDKEVTREFMPVHERKSGWEPYELEDAGHTVRKAAQLIRNKHLMGAVKKHHETRSKEHAENAHRIEMLSKSGRLSDKAMAKMRDRM